MDDFVLPSRLPTDEDVAKSLQSWNTTQTQSIVDGVSRSSLLKLFKQIRSGELAPSSMTEVGLTVSQVLRLHACARHKRSRLVAS
jgi:hypothetical protein